MKRERKKTYNVNKTLPSEPTKLRSLLNFVHPLLLAFLRAPALVFCILYTPAKATPGPTTQRARPKADDHCKMLCLLFPFPVY